MPSRLANPRPAGTDSAPTEHAPRRVVLAVDGSPASIDALRWAREHLIIPTDSVVVITAYQHPHYASEALITSADLFSTADRARSAAEEAIGTVFGPTEPGNTIDHIVELSSIDRLVEKQSDIAAFVVLGSRCRHRIRDRLRPSATNRITGQSSCPVISVPQSSGCSDNADSRIESDPDHAH